MSSLIAQKKTGHVNGATNDDVCPRHFIYLLSAFQRYQHTLSNSLRVAVIRTTSLRAAHLSSYTLQKRPVTHHWPTSRTRCSSALILLADLLLVGVARLASFSSPAYRSYRLLVYTQSPRGATSRTRCSSGLIPLTGLLLVRVARLRSFPSLA